MDLQQTYFNAVKKRAALEGVAGNPSIAPEARQIAEAVLGLNTQAPSVVLLEGHDGGAVCVPGSNFHHVAGSGDAAFESGWPPPGRY